MAPTTPPAPLQGTGRRRVLLNLALCLAILAGGAGVFALLASLKEPPAAREAPARTYNVEVFDVVPTDLQEIVSSFGTARADREVVLSSQVAGTIVEIHPQLRVGRRVSGPRVDVGAEGQSQRSAGELLVRIDPQTYRERVEQAARRLAEVESELDRVQQEQTNTVRLLTKVRDDYDTYKEHYERVRQLSERGVANRAELTRALLELKQYEEAILRHENEQKLFPLRLDQTRKRQESLEADLRLAQLDLERTEVRPPFTGALSEVMVEEGETVQAGTPLVRLTDGSQIEIPVPLTLGDYAKIEPELRAGRQPRAVLARNETAPGEWIGTVVRAAPRADEATRTIQVFVRVDNREQSVPLLPGTFVHARIDGPVLRQAIVVPRDAVINGQVFVAGRLQLGNPHALHGEAAIRPVTVARTLQSLAVLEAGLEPGEQLILTNLDVLHAGAPVRVQTRRTVLEELDRQRVKVARPLLAATEPAADQP